jgi:hypothetical protein
MTEIIYTTSVEDVWKYVRDNKEDFNLHTYSTEKN